MSAEIIPFPPARRRDLVESLVAGTVQIIAAQGGRFDYCPEDLAGQCFRPRWKRLRSLLWHRHTAC